MLNVGCCRAADTATRCPVRSVEATTWRDGGFPDAIPGCRFEAQSVPTNREDGVVTRLGELPTRFWRSGKQFLLTPDNQVWEKENGECYVWECYQGQYCRDISVPPIRWVDLVKDRPPVISITPVEAITILMLKRIEEVNLRAEAGLNEHKFDNDHYRPDE